MSLFNKVTEDWKTALKAGAPEKNVLAAIKSELQVRAKNDKVAELSDDVAISVIKKLCDVFRESSEFAKQAGRDELLAEAQFKLTVAQNYLPAQMSEDELKVIIKACIDEAGITSLKEAGKVMKLLMPKVKGKADGTLVQSLVKSFLQ